MSRPDIDEPSLSLSSGGNITVSLELARVTPYLARVGWKYNGKV